MARATRNMKIRKGDTVVVLSGKDRGNTGVVDRVIPETQRVLVEGINIVKRHTRPRPATSAAQANRPETQGGVIEKPAPIHVSNVALISPSTGKPVRVGWRTTDNGQKVRVSHRDNIDLDDTKGT